MRKIIFAAAAAGAALTLTACGETAETADETVDAVEADTEANMEAAAE